jgi:hypothetical protein
MYCHHCGNQVSPGASFCTSCGTPYTAAAAPAAVIPWTPPSGIQTYTGRWIGEGWRLVTRDLGTFVLMALVYALLTSAVPVIIQGPLSVGFHLFCAKKILGRRAEFADLFKGFDFFIPSLLASLLVSILVSVGLVFFLIPGLVLAAMYQFVYLFIFDKRMDFWPAMQASHAVVKNDYAGFCLFVLALIGINVLGFLCLIVGIFVTIPLSFAAVTVAYRDLVGFEPQTLASL